MNPNPAVKRGNSPVHDHVIFMEQLTSTNEEDRLNNAVDSFMKNSKTTIGMIAIGALGVVGMFALWNLKNILKIDIFLGGHHSIIDDINESLGL